MSLLSSVLGFQHTVRTPVGYAPGITSALHLGYGVNSKITGDTITKSLDIVRDGATATVSSQIRNREVTRNIDALTEMETEAQTVSDGLETAKTNFQTIKDNVSQIEDIVKTAEAGGFSASELDAQQVVINDLVTEINDLVESTTIDGKKVFDGSYQTRLTNGFNTNDYFDINFTNTGSTPTAPAVENTYREGDILDRFGDGVITTDDYLVVAAPGSNNGDPDQNNSIGKVYVYNRSDGSLRHELTPSNPVDNMRFGGQDLNPGLAIEDNLLVVGAPVDDGTYMGRIYGFDLNTGLEIFAVDNPNPTMNDGDSRFGNGISINNSEIIVSDEWYESSPGQETGVFYKFDFGGNLLSTVEGQQTTDLMRPDIVVGDKAYTARRVSSNNGFTANGAVRIYDVNTGVLTDTIISPNPGDGQTFGQIDNFGKYLLIGEYGGNGAVAPGFTGKAHLYNTETNQFEREYTPTTSTLDGGDNFGRAVAIEGNYVAVSAPGDDAAGANAGAVYVFDFATGDELFKITPTVGGEFGEEIRIEGGTLYVGSAGEAGERGAVYEYDLTSSLNVSENALNLRTDTVTEGSLGAFATTDLSKISISENVQSTGGIAELASSNTVFNVGKMTENLTRMEAILNSTSERVNNELSRITDKKTNALNEFFATLDTTNGGKNSVVQDVGFFYHPSPLPITTTASYAGTLLGNIVNSGVQGASPFAASSLLP